MEEQGRRQQEQENSLTGGSHTFQQPSEGLKAAGIHLASTDSAAICLPFQLLQTPPFSSACHLLGLSCESSGHFNLRPSSVMTANDDDLPRARLKATRTALARLFSHDAVSSNEMSKKKRMRRGRGRKRGQDSFLAAGRLPHGSQHGFLEACCQSGNEGVIRSQSKSCKLDRRFDPDAGKQLVDWCFSPAYRMNVHSSIQTAQSPAGKGSWWAPTGPGTWCMCEYQRAPP